MSKYTYNFINLNENTEEKNRLFNIYTDLIESIQKINKLKKKLLLDTLTKIEYNLYKNIINLINLYQKLYNKILSIPEIIEIINTLKNIETIEKAKKYFNSLEPVIFLRDPKSFVDRYINLYSYFKKNDYNYFEIIKSIIEKMGKTKDNEEIEIIRKIIIYITNEKLLFYDYYFSDIFEIYKNIRFLLSQDSQIKFGEGCSKYFCYIANSRNIPVLSLIVNKYNDDTQEHVLIHHNINEQIMNPKPLKSASLHLHSYAASLFQTTKIIHVDPLPIMLNILQKASKSDILKYDKVDIEKPICYRFKPSIQIFVTPEFIEFYKKNILT